MSYSAIERDVLNLSVQFRSWKRKIKIKHLLSKDDSDENAQRVAKEIYNILSKQKYMEDENLWEEVVWAFDDAHTCESLNDALDSLYDYADDYRIWIE